MVEALTCFQFSYYYQGDHLTLQTILSPYPYRQLAMGSSHTTRHLSPHYRISCQPSRIHQAEYHSHRSVIQENPNHLIACSY